MKKKKKVQWQQQVEWWGTDRHFARTFGQRRPEEYMLSEEDNKCNDTRASNWRRVHRSPGIRETSPRICKVNTTGENLV